MDSSVPVRLPLVVRIAIGLIAAICAVLIPGEAGRLMTCPLPVRRPRGRAASPLDAAALGYASPTA
jgi:hypothetical protein